MKFYFTIVLLILLCLAKLNAQQYYFNKRYNYGDVIWSVIETDSGYSCLAGSNGILILNIDFNGNIQWEKFYGMPQTVLYAGGPGSLIKTNDNNYVFAGSIEDTVNPDVMLWKYNNTGDTLWIRIYGDTLWQAGIQCKQTLDGGFIIIGATATFDYEGDFWLIKTDSMGNVEWDTIYGGQYYEYGLSVDVCSDGGYIMAGVTRSFGTNAGPFSQNADNVYVVKVDSMGNEQWNRVFGDSFADGAWNVEQTMDGGYIIGGYYSTDVNSWPDEFFSKPYIIKLDSSGNTEWERTYGTSEWGSGLRMVRELSDGGFIATGNIYDSVSPYNGLVLRIAANGDSLWYRKLVNLTGSSWNLLNDIKPTSDGGFIAAGWVFPEPPDTGGQDLWVVKMDSCGCLYLGCDSACQGLVSVNDELRITNNEFRVFPNPAPGKFTIEITGSSPANKPAEVLIYDVFGRVVKKIETRSKIIEADITHCPVGVYLIQFRNENTFYNIRVVKY